MLNLDQSICHIINPIPAEANFLQQIFLIYHMRTSFLSFVPILKIIQISKNKKKWGGGLRNNCFGVFFQAIT